MSLKEYKCICEVQKALFPESKIVIMDKEEYEEYKKWRNLNFYSKELRNLDLSVCVK